MNICNISGCYELVYSRGLCTAHYSKKRLEDPERRDRYNDARNAKRAKERRGYTDADIPATDKSADFDRFSADRDERIEERRRARELRRLS